MWRGTMWDGLVQWCATDAAFGRELVLRRASARAIRGSLERDRFSDVNIGQFWRTVCRSGRVLHPAGTPMEPDLLNEIDPECLNRMIEGGKVAIAGNYFLRGLPDPGTDRPEAPTCDRAPQTPLPGMTDSGGSTTSGASSNACWPRGQRPRICSKTPPCRTRSVKRWRPSRERSHLCC